jgi:hypothetical protein
MLTAITTIVTPMSPRQTPIACTTPSARSRAPSAEVLSAMADGTLDSQVGGRICNGLGIMRACLETQKLEQLEARMDEIANGRRRPPNFAPGQMWSAA